MMKKQNITKILAIASLMITPWTLRASVPADGQLKEESKITSAKDEIATLKEAALEGEPMDPSNLKKLFPGFRGYGVDDYFDPEDIEEYEDLINASIEKRNQDLNKCVRLLMEDTAECLSCNFQDDDKKTVSEDVSYSINTTLGDMLTDILALDYFQGQLSTEMVGQLLNYFLHVPYEEYLLAEDKKNVAESIIDFVVRLPVNVLNKADREKFNACCFQIWNELLKGTLWTRKESSLGKNEKDVCSTGEDSRKSDKTDRKNAKAN